MQLLKSSTKLTLAELTEIVGSNNVPEVLHINQLTRTRNIGQKFADLCEDIMNNTADVDWQRKSTLLNSFTQDSDIFEYVSCATERSWKVVSELGTLPNYMKLPEDLLLPPSEYVLGNNEPITEIIYAAVIGMLKLFPHVIDPGIFSEYSSIKPTSILTVENPGDPFQGFKIPWGQVTLHSSLTDDYIDFPVYPEEVTDARSATFTQMPDILYEYEPWQIYTGSGPRSNSYTFDFHRDMWSGDHRDGKANELVRFCEANCYPNYNGSAVNVSIVTLWVAGSMLIRGVMTNVETKWDGPLGLDGWYLHCVLTIQITEVSEDALSFDVVKNKPLIG